MSGHQEKMRGHWLNIMLGLKRTEQRAICGHMYIYSHFQAVQLVAKQRKKGGSASLNPRSRFVNNTHSVCQLPVNISEAF